MHRSVSLLAAVAIGLGASAGEAPRPLHELHRTMPNGFEVIGIPRPGAGGACVALGLPAGWFTWPDRPAALASHAARIDAALTGRDGERLDLNVGPGFTLLSTCTETEEILPLVESLGRIGVPRTGGAQEHPDALPPPRLLPSTSAGRQLYRSLHAAEGAPGSREPAGDAGELTRGAARFRRSTRSPLGAWLAIVGDFDPFETLPRAGRVFGSWPVSASAPSPEPEAPGPREADLRLRLDEAGATASAALGGRIIGPEGPRAAAVARLLAALATGRARERLEKAKETGIEVRGSVLPGGVWIVEMSGESPGRLAQAAEAALTDLEPLAREIREGLPGWALAEAVSGRLEGASLEEAGLRRTLAPLMEGRAAEGKGGGMIGETAELLSLDGPALARTLGPSLAPGGRALVVVSGGKR